MKIVTMTPEELAALVEESSARGYRRGAAEMQAAMKKRLDSEPSGGDLLTVKQASELTGISRKTLYYHINKGSIASTRVGGQLFIRRDAVVPKEAA